MSNEFNCKGGEQNVAQGDNAIGKQENTTQPVSGDGNIFSGTGNVTVNQGLRMKPRTVVLASVLAAAVFGGGLAAWHWLAPPKQSTAGNQSSAIVAGGNVDVTSYVVPSEDVAKYAKELGATEQVVNSFFGTLLERNVPRDQWDKTLREIAAQHKELLARLDSVKSEDPQVVKLKQEAKQAIEVGDYAKAEELLNQAEALDLKAIEQMEKAAKQRRISAAATNADQAKLQEVQLYYAKAAAYWQRAAALLPEDKKKERALYLHKAGYDLDRIARYAEALPLYEQSLAIRQELGDKAGEGTTLNGIGLIYKARGDYPTALKYLEQSLRIMQHIGGGICQKIHGKACEGAALNNIGEIHRIQGDYDKALPLYEQSLVISREINNKQGEGATLNNISLIYWTQGNYTAALTYLEQSLVIGDKKQKGITLSNIGLIYDAQGDYAIALKYLEQSLTIQREIGDKAGEAVTSWNIGRVYENQGDLANAESYMSRTVQIDEEIGRPELKWERKTLAEIRAKLPGR